MMVTIADFAMKSPAPDTSASIPSSWNWFQYGLVL